MNYLGSSRVITNQFSTHITAEDYAGEHKSPVSIYGKGKIIKVVGRFKSHEDSINYNNFLENQNNWKDGDYYNCISITGKQVRMRYDELGGNQVDIETYDGEKMIYFKIAHLDSVSVNVGDIIDENTIIGYQGNTGLVLSNKSLTDVTYGSHVHLEVKDSNNNYINPRTYASGLIKTTYIEQTNTLNPNKYQLKVNVDKINIRENSSINSNIIGAVYMNEIYNILEEIVTEPYKWYKITTNTGVTGYIANLEKENWLTIYKPEEENASIENNNNSNSDETILFECEEDGYYYVYLYKGEKLFIK